MQNLHGMLQQIGRRCFRVAPSQWLALAVWCILCAVVAVYDVGDRMNYTLSLMGLKGSVLVTEWGVDTAWHHTVFVPNYFGVMVYCVMGFVILILMQRDADA